MAENVGKPIDTRVDGHQALDLLLACADRPAATEHPRLEAIEAKLDLVLQRWND